MNNSISNQPDSKIILFDGVCVLCNYWARFIIQYDTQKKFKLASVQSSIGQEILKYYDMPTTTFDTLLYVEGLELKASLTGSVVIKNTDKSNNQLFIKTAAIFKVMSQLGMPWRLAAIFKIVPTALNDCAYDLIARNRYHIFGKKEYCILPKPDHASRYLSDQ
jgi:predicted DCC family thiol-disulfide oxidoreductase YuxK